MSVLELLKKPDWLIMKEVSLMDQLTPLASVALNCMPSGVIFNIEMFDMLVILGGIVSIVKLLVTLVPVLPALSMHCTRQEWLPSDMLLVEKIVAVSLITEELVLFAALSRKRVQFIVGERLSTAMKLNAIIEEFEKDELAGELRLIDGGAVSTVKLTF